MIDIFRLGTATDVTLRSGAFQTRLCALTEPHPLLFRHRREHANHSVLEDTCTVEILLRERAIDNAVPCEPLETIQRLYGAFTAQTIKAPEQKAIELSTRCRPRGDSNPRYRRERVARPSIFNSLDDTDGTVSHCKYVEETPLVYQIVYQFGLARAK